MKGTCPFCAKSEQLYHCSGCDLKLCYICIQAHRDRSGHKPEIDPQHQNALKWTLGKIGKWAELSKEKLFQQDESAKWFGVRQDPKDKLLWLIETRRVEHLLVKSRTESQHVRTFPRFVTFIGQTGVGKSTIIRGLMAARCDGDLAVDDSPIPGKPDTPCRSTTGEVNLYADPQTFSSSSPILYVDCEGFGGTESVAAQFQNRWYSNDVRYRDYRIEESNTDATSSRTQVAKDIYPRFLYIFSDVICLVVEQTRLICDAVTRLLKWSQASSRVVNQSSMPSAIIIINNWDPSSWNSSEADSHGSLEDEVYLVMERQAKNDHFLEGLMNKAKTSHNISTLKELIKLYYSSFQICCIPRTHYNDFPVSTPEAVINSYRELGTQIVNHSESVTYQRQQNWARLDSGQLQTLFDHAFKHFASGRSEAFDFNRSLQRMELPSSASDHISVFLDILLREKLLREEVETRFSFAAIAIAGSLSIEVIANPALVPLPDAILGQKLKDDIHAGAQKFLDRSLRCAFTNSDGVRCINTRMGHLRAHQSEEGEALGNGDFEPGNFTPGNLLDMVAAEARKLISIANEKVAQDRQSFLVEKHSRILQSAYQNILLPKADQGLSLAKFSPMCFGCLIRKPEYCLPCDHYICAICIDRFQEKGQNPNSPHVASHTKCFLCGTAEPVGSWPVSVALQPPLAGVRVLSLDGGGGSRGIVELEVLRRLEQKIGLGIPITKFFDFIIGTNAGGYIATGLGVHTWNLETASAKLSHLLNEGLVPRNFPWRVWGWFASGPESYYDGEKFGEKLCFSISDAETDLFGLRPSNTAPLNLPRVAVTVSQTNKAFLLANYNYGDNKTYLDSRRSTGAASRATWASPYYFPPFKESMDKDDLFDGGLFHNNPTAQARDEVKRIWPENPNVDVIISLGSGKMNITKKLSMVYESNLEPWVRKLKDKYYAEIEGMEESQYNNHNDPAQKQHASEIRLHVKCTNHKFDLYGSAERFHDMKQVVSSCDFSVSNVNLLAKAATRLKASLFYWDMEKLDYSSNGKAVNIKGTIRCRVLEKTTSGPTTKLLEELLQGLLKRKDNAFCLTRGKLNESPLKQYLTKGTTSCNGTRFEKEIQFTIDVEDEKEQNVIEVAFQCEGKSRPEGENQAPISGSPFSLTQLHKHGIRHLQPVVEKVETGLIMNFKPW